MGLEEILRGLEPCLAESGIDFDGEIMRLHNRAGVPTALSLETGRVSTLLDVTQCARPWWGVSLYCISRPLAEALGRTDAMEVYLRVLKKSPHQ
jgi:hypothetical protein